MTVIKEILMIVAKREVDENKIPLYWLTLEIDHTTFQSPDICILQSNYFFLFLYLFFTASRVTETFP